jgi:hypothetical protein
MQLLGKMIIQGCSTLKHVKSLLSLHLFLLMLLLVRSPWHMQKHFLASVTSVDAQNGLLSIFLAAQNGPFNMVQDHKLLKEMEVAAMNFTRSARDIDLSKTLYLSILSTLSSTYQMELEMYKSVIQQCGVRLLYFVLRYSEERNARCTSAVGKLLTKLPTLFRDHSYTNMHEICSILHSKRLLDDYKFLAGNNLNQVYFNLCTAFVDLEIPQFTQKLLAWEDKHCSNSTTLQEQPSTILLYLRTVPDIMDMCIDEKVWLAETKCHLLNAFLARFPTVPLKLLLILPLSKCRW